MSRVVLVFVAVFFVGIGLSMMGAPVPAVILICGGVGLSSVASALE